MKKKVGGPAGSKQAAKRRTDAKRKRDSAQPQETIRPVGPTSRNEPKPPETYEAFLRCYPKLAEAWEKIGEAGRIGPLDDKAVRLIKLAIAIGAMRKGAVHSGVRKALARGIPAEEIEQVIALAASTLGMPATVAVFSWVRDEIDKRL